MCVADVSWSVHVIVVPDVIVRLEGEKFRPVPAPWGMVMVAVPDAPLVDVVVLVIGVDVEAVVVVDAELVPDMLGAPDDVVVLVEGVAVSAK